MAVGDIVPVPGTRFEDTLESASPDHATDRIVAPPVTGPLTLGSDPARFQEKPPACYRASWQLPGPDSHRQATTSLRTRRSTVAYVTVSPTIPLGARKIRARPGTGASPCPCSPTRSSPSPP